MKRKIVLLIDGHNLLFRMFYGIPSSIKNTRGREIKGLIGFIGSIKKLVAEFKPYSVAVIFDSETSKNNNEKIDKTYKANRKDYSNINENHNPFSQLFMIKRALEYLNICHLEVENNEADDYIASIINNEKFNCFEFIITSTDSDFIQLINKHVFLLVSRGKHSILYNEEIIKKKYNIHPKQYISFKSLTGDVCDNIQGVKGIGQVTAANILKYGDINNFVRNSGNTKLVKLIVNNLNKISVNEKLITMNCDLDTSLLKLNKISEKLISQKVNVIIKNIGEL